MAKDTDADTVHPRGLDRNPRSVDPATDAEIAADLQRMIFAYRQARLPLEHLPRPAWLAAWWGCPLRAAEHWRHLAVTGQPLLDGGGR